MKYASKLLACLSLCVLPLLAVAQILPPPQLNTISYRFVQEGWANTNTAKVRVDFDAALDQVNLSNANASVLENLKKIANTNWHIVTFERTKDSSGLEKLHLSAEARLPETALAGIYDKAKSISKAGGTYTVAGIDFTPSLAAIEQTRAALRAAIYEQAKQEVARLNQLNPGQNYFLNSIYFDTEPQVQPMVQEMKVMQLGNGVAAAKASVGISLNAKVVQTAQVTIASVVPDPARTPAAVAGVSAAPAAR